MSASSKRFGLQGLNANVEFGKNGLKFISDGSAFQAKSNNELSLVEIKAADGTTSQSLVTKAQLDAKQGSLSIAESSQGYLQLDGDVLSVKNLLVQDVHVDNSALTLAQFVASGYSGSEFQEGDILILAASSDAQQRSFIHNGGTAGDATDFTRLQVDLSETVIRAMFSAGTGIAYNSTTGEITVDATSAEITADATGFTVISGANAQAVFASIDAALVSLDGRVDALEASMATIDVNNITHFAKVDFDFQSGNTFNIGSVIPAGRIIKSVMVKVITAFDDVSSTMQVGEAGDIDSLVSVAHVDLQEAGVYSVETFNDLGANTQIICTLNAGISTQGAGKILVEYC